MEFESNCSLMKVSPNLDMMIRQTYNIQAWQTFKCYYTVNVKTGERNKTDQPQFSRHWCNNVRWMLNGLSLSWSEHLCQCSMELQTASGSGCGDIPSPHHPALCGQPHHRHGEAKWWQGVELHAMMLQGGSSYHKGMLTTKALYQFAFVLT